jgi:hypothetical protein
MSLDLESLGGGAGAGLIGAILGIFGINRRINKIEDCKQDKSVCEATHKSIDEKFTILIDGQSKLFDKVDSINEYLRNQK